MDKLPVYAEVGVPEVWCWEAKTIRVRVVREGRYVESPHSELLRGIDLGLLASFLERTSTSAAKREYWAALTD